MKKMILMQTSMSAFTQLNAKNYIRLIRNATLKMEYAGKQILVDPLLGAKGSSVSALGVNPNPRVNLTMPVEEVLDGLDFTLLTHNHPDHYDETAVKLIRKDMPWFGETESVGYLTYRLAGEQKLVFDFCQQSLFQQIGSRHSILRHHAMVQGDAANLEQ
jgi:L-ascorbate metabolism protein UlaG (beta-lactamase superfamily)